MTVSSGSIVPVARGTASASLRVDEHLEPGERSRIVGELGDVVVVVVGQQHVRGRRGRPPDRLESGGDRAAGVDEDGVAARLVGDQVGVRQQLSGIERSRIMAATLPRDARGTLPPMELIHTCYRIGDIDRSVAFYEALGFEEIGRMPIRDEAINVFMGLPGDGAAARADLQPRRRLLRARHRLQPHRRRGRGPRRARSAGSPRRASSPRSRPTPSATAARGCASCATRTAIGSS